MSTGRVVVDVWPCGRHVFRCTAGGAAQRLPIPVEANGIRRRWAAGAGHGGNADANLTQKQKDLQHAVENMNAEQKKYSDLKDKLENAYTAKSKEKAQKNLDTAKATLDSAHDQLTKAMDAHITEVQTSQIGTETFQPQSSSWWALAPMTLAGGGAAALSWAGTSVREVVSLCTSGAELAETVRSYFSYTSAEQNSLGSRTVARARFFDNVVMAVAQAYARVVSDRVMQLLVDRMPERLRTEEKQGRVQAVADTLLSSIFMAALAYWGTYLGGKSTNLVPNKAIENMSSLTTILLRVVLDAISSKIRHLVMTPMRMVGNYLPNVPNMSVSSIYASLSMIGIPYNAIAGGIPETSVGSSSDIIDNWRGIFATSAVGGPTLYSALVSRPRFLYPSDTVAISVGDTSGKYTLSVSHFSPHLSFSAGTSSLFVDEVFRVTVTGEVAVGETPPVLSTLHHHRRLKTDRGGTLGASKWTVQSHTVASDDGKVTKIVENGKLKVDAPPSTNAGVCVMPVINDMKSTKEGTWNLPTASSKWNRSIPWAVLNYKDAAFLDECKKLFPVKNSGANVAYSLWTFDENFGSGVSC